jgi:hypothetical protein
VGLRLPAAAAPARRGHRPGVAGRPPAPLRHRGHRAVCLRAARAGLGLGDGVSRQQAEADSGHVVVWALAEPDVGRSYRELLGAAVLFLGTGGDRFRRATLLTRRAVAAADRVLRQRRRGPDGGVEG